MIVASNFRPIKKTILVSEIESGMQYRNGIIIPDDDMKERGIHARWAKVAAIGPDVYDIEVGDWVLVEHGRWGRGIEMCIAGVEATYRNVDFDDLYVVQKEKPEGITTK